MTDRVTQPNRRLSQNFSFKRNGMTHHVTFSHDVSGAPYEMFMVCGKAGTDIEALARDMAVVTSLALQYGCPLDVLKTALTKGEHDVPAGPLGIAVDMIDTQMIKWCNTIAGVHQAELDDE